MRPWSVTHDAAKGTAVDYRSQLARVEQEVGVSGDPRGVGGYQTSLPPPLPYGSGQASYDQIDTGQGLGTAASLWTSTGAVRVNQARPADADGDGLTTSPAW